MKKRKWFLTLFIVLIICGLIGTGIAAFIFVKTPEPTTVSSTIEFTFVGAADGIAPNGLAFDINDITSDTVLNAALEDAGLNSLYTSEQVRSSLKVIGQYPDDLLEQATGFTSLINYDSKRSNLISSYHPTMFSVILDNRFDSAISETSQTSLLSAVMNSYFNYFKNNYGASFDLQSFNKTYNLIDYDYIQQLEILEQQMETVSQYSLEMYNLAPTFRLNGITFDNISVRLSNLTNSSVTQLSSNMFLNAIARNPQRLLNQYQFSLRNLVFEKDAKQANLDNLDMLIDSFERNGNVYLSTNSTFTEINGNSLGTYTELNNLKTALMNNLSAINSKIAIYQTRMNDMTKTAAEPVSADTDTDQTLEAATDTGEDADHKAASSISSEDLTETIEAAEAVTGRRIGLLQRQIDSIVNERDKIVADFQTMLNTYTDQQINTGTVSISSIKYKAPSLFSFAFIKKAIKMSIPICFIGFVLCNLLILPSLRKRYSWENLD